MTGVQTCALPIYEAQLEWIELHNLMAVDMDLSGWTLGGGVQFTFAEGTVLGGGKYLVIGGSPATLMAATGLTNVFGPFTGQLSNNGDTLELRLVGRVRVIHDFVEDDGAVGVRGRGQEQGGQGEQGG